jgi:ubiquinol-cytochrome c reductase cytochrome b subunit
MSGHKSTYEPKTGFTRWLDSRLPIIRLAHDTAVSYPTPKNLNFWWTFGGILTACLVVQIVTGIVLAMHYVPHVDHAFDSVQRFVRDVPWGWLIQPMHAVGASMFFLAVYIHMFRGLYYGSYKAPREVLWILGCVIYLLMVVTGFLGYTLPWGQMSFWAATVITNILGAVPVVGESIQVWIRGGGAIDNATLNRFFSLHYLMPFVIAGVVLLHIWALHVTGQNNPAGIEPKDESETVPFTPYATAKDLFALAIFALLFAVFVFYLPNALGHPDNYNKADALVTPPHIVPEWYLLPFYAILRAIDFNIGPIDSKFGGVIAMFASIAVLFVLPWLDTLKVRSMRYRPLARQFFLVFVAVCLALGWCGGQTPDQPVAPHAPYTATLTWAEGGSLASRPLSAASAEAMGSAIEDATAEMKQQGAQIVYIERASATAATAQSITGGTLQSKSLSAPSADAVEAEIAAAKAALPADVPFVQVTRETPFVFTVTRFSQVLTAYYFLFFLVILPLLGLSENPRGVPASITQAIAKPQKA